MTFRRPSPPPSRGAARPVPRREEDTHLTHAAVARRPGWDSQLIHSLLGPPEIVQASRKDPREQVRLWRRERVTLAETHPRMRGHLEVERDILSANARIDRRALQLTHPRDHPLRDVRADRRRFVTGRFILPLRTPWQPHDLWEMLSGTFPHPGHLDALSSDSPEDGMQRGAGSHVLISALAHAYPHLWPELKDYAAALDLQSELKLPQLSVLHPTGLSASLNAQIALARTVWALSDPRQPVSES